MAENVSFVFAPNLPSICINQ